MGMIHVVGRGETLETIAAFYGVSVARLRSDNGLILEQTLVEGQALVVLRPSGTYTVQNGDTFSRIAGETGVSVRRLLQLNPTAAQSGVLYAGEVLTTGLLEEPETVCSVGGYAYPHIQNGVLRRCLPFLQTLSVFSYGFRENGMLVEPEDSRLLSEAGELDIPAVLVLTSIDGSGTFSTERASRLFRDSSLQEAVLHRIMAVMKEKGYQGLDMDFEYIEPEDAESYFSFLGTAAERVHEIGGFLQVDLAPKTYREQPGLLYTSHNYPVIGSIADRVLLMTYEWGYSYGPPMAVAPLPQVEAVLRYGLREIPAWKIHMGIPNYGYDWILPYERGRRAVTLGNQEAVLLASQIGAVIRFDETAQTPFFQYERAGEEHIVWFEDARSIRKKLELALNLGISGIEYWNLLRPFSQNWSLISQEIYAEKFA